MESRTRKKKARKQVWFTKAGVVYEITCDMCNKSYIGETGRNVETTGKRTPSPRKEQTS